MYVFYEFKIKVRRRSAWHGYQWCVRTQFNNIQSPGPINQGLVPQSRATVTK